MKAIDYWRQQAALITDASDMLGKKSVLPKKEPPIGANELPSIDS